MLTTGYFCEHRWDEYLAADAKLHQSDFMSAMASGQKDEQERQLRKTIDQANAGLQRPYLAASFAVVKGKNSLALDLLEKSYDHHDYWLLFTNVDPQWDPVRSDPRFQAIMRRIGVVN